jgi:hypothetical protein
VCIHAIFTGFVSRLTQDDLLDITVIHCDGTTTAAKKDGHNVGICRHKKDTAETPPKPHSLEHSTANGPSRLKTLARPATSESRSNRFTVTASSGAVP